MPHEAEAILGAGAEVAEAADEAIAIALHTTTDQVRQGGYRCFRHGPRSCHERTRAAASFRASSGPSGS